MPISQNTYTVPNNFVQQYDLGQKKIRADLVDENFTDAAGAINTLLTDVAANDAAAVHLTGAETIIGDKTFSGSNTFSEGNTFSGNNTFSGSNTFSEGNTFSGNNTFSGSNTFSGTVNLVKTDGSNLSGATVKAVVDAGETGTSWYRKWSDGFVEQGGSFSYSGTSANQSASISFPKAFTNTNYVVIIYSFNATNSSGHCVVNGKTTAGVTYVQPASVPYASWYACGF